MNVQEYSVALITVSGSQKNPTNIAREAGVDQSTVSRFLNRDLRLYQSTVKQSLGFGKCFSTKSEAYLNHIKAAGLAYCKLQKLIKKLKLDSAEESIRYIQAQKNILQLAQRYDLVSFSEIYA